MNWRIASNGSSKRGTKNLGTTRSVLTILLLVVTLLALVLPNRSSHPASAAAQAEAYNPSSDPIPFEVYFQSTVAGNTQCFEPGELVVAWAEIPIAIEQNGNCGMWVTGPGMTETALTLVRFEEQLIVGTWQVPMEAQRGYYRVQISYLTTTATAVGFGYFAMGRGLDMQLTVVNWPWSPGHRYGFDADISWYVDTYCSIGLGSGDVVFDVSVHKKGKIPNGMWFWFPIGTDDLNLDFTVPCQIPFPGQVIALPLGDSRFSPGSYRLTVAATVPGVQVTATEYFEVGEVAYGYVDVSVPSAETVKAFAPGEWYRIPVRLTAGGGDKNVQYGTPDQKIEMKVEVYDSRPNLPPSGLDGEDSTRGRLIGVSQRELIPGSDDDYLDELLYQWKASWDPDVKVEDPANQGDYVDNACYGQNIVATAYLRTWLGGLEDWSPWYLYTWARTNKAVSPYPLHPVIYTGRGDWFLDGITIDNTFYITMKNPEEDPTSYDPYDYVEAWIGDKQLPTAFVTDNFFDGTYSFECFQFYVPDMSQYSPIAAGHDTVDFRVVAHLGDDIGIAHLPLHYLQTPVWLQEFDQEQQDKPRKLGIVDAVGEGYEPFYGRGWAIQLKESATVAGLGWPNAEIDWDNTSNWEWPVGDVPIIGGRYGFKAGVYLWDSYFGTTPVLLVYNPAGGDGSMGPGNPGAAQSAKVSLILADKEVLQFRNGNIFGDRTGVMADNQRTVTLRREDDRVVGGRGPSDPVFGPFTLNMVDVTVPIWSWPGLSFDLLGQTFGIYAGVRLKIGLDATARIYEVDSRTKDQELFMQYDGLTWGGIDDYPVVEITPSVCLEAYGGLNAWLFGVEAVAYGCGEVHLFLPPPLVRPDLGFFSLCFGLKVNGWIRWVGSGSVDIIPRTCVDIPSKPEPPTSASATQSALTTSTSGLGWIPRYWAGHEYAQVDWIPGSLQGTYLTNPFPYSQPTIATQGDRAVQVWLQDDLAGTYPASTEVYSSVLDLDTMEWSNPIRITSDHLHQWGSPVVAFDGNGNAVAVWNVLNQADVTEKTPLDNALTNKTELQYAIWNHQTGNWSAPQLITQDTVADTVPALERTSDGRLILVWESSDDPLGSPLVDLKTLWWDGSAWTSPKVIAQDVPLYSTPSVASEGQSVGVAWAQDMDGDYATLDDTELFYAYLPGSGQSWNAPVRLTNNAVADRSPSLAPTDYGNISLAWIESSGPRDASDTQQALRYAWNVNNPSLLSEVAAVGGAMSEPHILSDADGRTVVVWKDDLLGTPVYSVGLAEQHWTDPLPLIRPAALESELGSEACHTFTSYAMTESGQILVADVAKPLKAVEETVKEEWAWTPSVMFVSTVELPPPSEGPSVLGVDPSAIPQGSAQTVRIIGTNLGEATAVDFGPGASVLGFDAGNSTCIVAAVAVSSNADLGSRSVSVTTSQGKSTLQNAYTVTAAPAALTSVAPNQGARGQTLDVTITGMKLDGAGQPNFGPGITVNSFTLKSPTDIRANISVADDAVLGYRNVWVTTPAGTATLYHGFTVTYPVPEVTLITPREGCQGQTMDVTITGTHLSKATEIDFGSRSGVTVNSFTADSPTQITANITVGADAIVGSRNVRVSSAGGTGTLTGGFEVVPSIPRWDINHDAKVDYKDLAMLGAHYGETTSTPYPAWDINDDAKVDYKDLAMLGARYGNQYVEQLPQMQWTNTYGGSGADTGYAVQQTADGGYIVAGTTVSYGAGLVDAWLVKTDAAGNQVWSRTFGGSGIDWVYSVQQTADGGYIVAGYTNSSGAGGNDAWLIKTDGTGNKLWERTFGGSAGDAARSVQRTADGGYIIAGYTASSGAGGNDAWLIKTDAAGNKVWSQTFGGSLADAAYSVKQTGDGGYIIAGYTASSGAGGNDVWLIKTDAAGNKSWDKTFGGSASDVGNCVQRTADGGYIIAGYTASSGAGGNDVWLIKTDGSGNKLWDRTFGGSESDVGNWVQQTATGGYVITGSYGSAAGDVWLIKADGAGNRLWDQTFGGSGSDIGYSVQQTDDGGYVIAGSTSSYGAGSSDVWLMKVGGA